MEPRIITPQEAREALRDFAGSPSTFLASLARTVATEDERIRAAVVRELQNLSEHEESIGNYGMAMTCWARATAIKDGAPY